jgi:hypothetical protein
MPFYKREKRYGFASDCKGYEGLMECDDYDDYDKFTNDQRQNRCLRKSWSSIRKAYYKFETRGLVFE